MNDNLAPLTGCLVEALIITENKAANENRASNLCAFGPLTEKPSSIVVTGNQFSSEGV